MKNTDECLVLALAIQRIPRLRSDERLKLWDIVDDERSLSLLSREDIEAELGRDLGHAAWAPDSRLEEAAGDARFLERSGCRFIHYDEDSYPTSLRETAHPPFGLFARGMDLEAAAVSFAAAEAVAIVGTRTPTGRGLDAAFSLARDLCSAGLPVISGLARGIDSAAHRGALAGARGAAGGRTCAVLPCGIDRVYPPGNKALASAILEEGGLLLSEYPPGTEIRKYHFPERNRIIAGMARACIVVEAPAKSGALITAEHALDEGRDVWVAADCLGGQRSAGIDRLAEDGAPALCGAEELLSDWGFGQDAPSGGRSGTGDLRNDG
jgi:DNA processing protein